MPTKEEKKRGKECDVPVFKLYLHRLLILASYCQLMKDIYAYLAERVSSENKDAPESERIPERVNGKLVTPKYGIFLVQLIPENDSEKIVTLLFRCWDLYLDSYHCDGVWYRLSDHEAELPLRDQLHYLEEGGIVDLGISSSYADLGGADVDIGHEAFTRCYYALRKTNTLLLSEKGVKALKAGPLATPAVGIAEAVRFAFLQKLVKGSLSSGDNIHITSTISAYFNQWGSYSSAMYTKKIPEGCLLTLVQISNKLWVIRRQNLKDEVTSNEDEKPLASLLAWHEEDNKRLVHAVCNVGDINDTVKFYRKGFGLKLLREVSEKENRSGILGYGPEKTNFAIRLDYNHGIRKYDMGNGFGHLAIASENVSKTEKRIMSNGGEIGQGLSVVNGRSTAAVFAKDRNGYKFELVQRTPEPEPLCKIMLRIGDLGRSIKFYEKALGMKLLTRIDVPEHKYAIARLGYADEHKTTVLELTYKYGIKEYQHGNAYSQIVIATDNVGKSAEAVERIVKILGGRVLLHGSKIASFIDPDGWKTVLVDQADLIEEIGNISTAKVA